MFAPQTLGSSLPASPAVFKVDLFVKSLVIVLNVIFIIPEKRLIAINGNARFPLSFKKLSFPLTVLFL